MVKHVILWQLRDELSEDEKILSIQDYIDSTLLMKINYINIKEKL